MDPSAPGLLRDLRRLADQLFDTVLHEYTADTPLDVRFERIDDLSEAPIEEKHLVVLTLACAQLLHRVTAEPAQARPRHVQTLTDILEQVIPALVASRPQVSPAAAADLRSIADGMSQAASHLIFCAGPGGFAYEAHER